MFCLRCLPRCEDDRVLPCYAQQGYDILKPIDFPWSVAEVALQHHERINGSDYPRGLKGDAILLEAYIVSVAEVVEACLRLFRDKGFAIPE